MNWRLRPRKELQAGRPSEEAADAATEARRALADVENLACRVNDVTDRLAKTRERNHFAAAIARAIRGV